MTAHPPRFLIAERPATGDLLALGSAEAKHARVRRLRAGDPVALFDGAGRSYLGRLESLSRERASVRVTAVLPERAAESPLELVLAIALLKADRLDWVVEKATELGVHRIRPFASTTTLAHPSRARQQRWQQIALAAAKQCGRSVTPAIEPPAALSAVLAAPAAARVLFAEDGSGAALEAVAVTSPGPLLVIVGAEGGFTPAELAVARAAGCHAVGLGPRILRAETAAVTAVALCQARWGDLHGR